jgi:hypothetical protein
MHVVRLGIVTPFHDLRQGFSPIPACVIPDRGVEMDSGPIGRDGAVAKISAFLAANSKTPVVLAITGDAGIGKSVVWKHSVQTACQSSRVLMCQPPSTERPLVFSALDDLLAEVAEEILPAPKAGVPLASQSGRPTTPRPY